MRGDGILKAIGLVLALSGQARAAEKPAATPPPEPLADIIVTGEKIDRTIQSTITSVRVFEAAEIRRENLTSLFDVINRTANLTTTFANSGFTIRGIANDNVTGVGTGDLATVYLDGSPLPREALTAGPLDLWDLAAVEVLRGPQSTLQGRNALAGSIVMRTTDPSYRWTGQARIILTGKGQERRFSAAVGGPIIDGQLAFRIAAEHSRADGFIKNPTRHTDREGFRDSDTIRAKLLFTPEALPGLRIVASYLHDRHSRGATYSLDDYPGAFDHRILLSNRPTINRTKTDIATLDASYDLGGGLALNSVTTYDHIRPKTVYDGDNLAEDIAYGSFSQNHRIFTEELRLTLSKGPLTGVLGAYFSRLSNPHDRSASTFALSPEFDLGLDHDIAVIYPPELLIDTRQHYPQTVTTAAIFGDGTWAITPKLKLRFGFRYDHERNKRANSNLVTLRDPLPDPADYGADGPTVQAVNDFINGELLAANSSSPAAKTKFHAFLPKLGITYDFTGDMSLSATVQRGYRSGGSGVNPGRGQLYTYKPEYTWNYELALRSLWLSRKLSVNANLFYIDWKDQQVLVYLDPDQNIYDYATINAGKSRVWGGELEIRYQPNRRLSTYASLGYTNTRFLKFKVDGAVGDLSGVQFASAPHWTFAAGASWQHPRGWYLDVNANYRSSAFQQPGDSEKILRGRWLANAKLGWQNDHFGAFFTATNIFNQKWFNYSYLDYRHQSLFGDPRVLGVTFEAKF